MLGLADGGAEHVGEAGAHPVDGGVAGGVAEREDGEGEDTVGVGGGVGAGGFGAGGAEVEEAGDGEDEGEGCCADPEVGELFGGFFGEFEGGVEAGDLASALVGVEVGEDFGDALVATVDVALEAAGDDFTEGCGDGGVEGVAGDCGLLRAHDEAGDRALGDEGHGSGEELEEHDADGEDVGALVDGFTEGLLGGHVVHGSDERAGLSHAVVLEGAGEAKVHDEGAAGGLFHEDVLRLEVAVDYAYGVGGLEGAADLADEGDGLLLGEAAFLADDGVEVASVDVLHGDELHAFGFAEVVDADDVFVGDLGGEEELLLEALDDGAVAGELGTDDLEADGAADLDVPGFVDGAHAADAEHLDDFVTVAEEAAGFELALDGWRGGHP